MVQLSFFNNRTTFLFAACLLVPLFISGRAHSQEAGLARLTPERIIAQTGGYQGASNVGVQYLLNHFYAMEWSVGYTSAKQGGHVIRQINWKNRLNLLSSYHGLHRSFDAYLHAGFLYSPDSDLFVMLPKKYPQGYYAPTALRFLLGAGIEARVLQQWDVFAELNFVDSELFAHKQSAPEGDERTMGSLGLGVRYRL